MSNEFCIFVYNVKSTGTIEVNVQSTKISLLVSPLLLERLTVKSEAQAPIEEVPEEVVNII